MDLKQALKGKLTKKELDRAARSYDLIGDIAIVEIPRTLVKKEKTIAKALLNLHKNIKAVYKKGKHTGVFRTQKLNWLAGEKRKGTEHRENNVRLRLNVESSYFSPRMASERKRIAEQVKKNEAVLVMFSGIGPYPIVIAKNSKPKEIYSVEINPKAAECQQENILINKIQNIRLFKGDVRKIVPRLNKKFDRILMPLPKGAESFLDIALNSIKKKGIIHFYDFLREEEIPEKAIEKIKLKCIKAKKKYKILKTVKCGQLAPRQYRVCIDFGVL